MYSFEEANGYLTNEVLHNAAWLEADQPKQERALKNAANELYADFTKFTPNKRPLPPRAIFEQAIWILRKDDSMLKAEQGVTNINISGEFSLGLGGKTQRISPAAIKLIRAKKVGRYL